LRTARAAGKKHTRVADEFAELRVREDMPGTTRPIEVPDCHHRPTDRPCGQVNYRANLYDDAQVQALDMIWKLHNAELGQYRAPGHPTGSRKRRCNRASVRRRSDRTARRC
jgi:hypothetical protein